MLLTLTTDFGWKDGYVGILKGVALGITPSLNFVDISHDVEPGDIRSAAWIITNAYRYFPESTVHVVIVDPGVGSARKGVVLRKHKQLFVCPDNGLLTYLLAHEGHEETVYQISNEELMLSSVSSTFHGRDVFVPVAARLASGLEVSSVGPQLCCDELHRFDWPELTVVDKSVSGCVVYIDRFGNLITNINSRFLAGAKSVCIKETQVSLATTYSSVSSQELGAIPGSHGFIEIAANCGRANELLSASVGDYVHLAR